MTKNKTLTTLNLGSNKIGTEGAKALAKALETNKTLTTLNLWGNEIGPEGAKALAKALETNKILTTLNLGSNKIGDDGVKALVKALETNKTLTTLNLGSNKIGDDGVKALVKALETNKTLTTLNLWGNEIGPEGAIALAKSLEKNKTLTTLNLEYNQIGPEAAKALAKLTHIDVIVNYDVSKTYNSHKIAHKLIESLPGLTKRNSEIKSVAEITTKDKPLTYKFLKLLKESGIDEVVNTIIEIQGGDPTEDRKKEIKDTITEHLGRYFDGTSPSIKDDSEPKITSSLGSKITQFASPSKYDAEKKETHLDFAIDQQKQREVKITTNNMLAGLKASWTSIDIDILKESVQDFLDLEKNPAGKEITFTGNNEEIKNTQSKSLKDRIAYLDRSTIKDHLRFKEIIKPLIEDARSIVAKEPNPPSISTEYSTPNPSARKPSLINQLLSYLPSNFR